MILPDLLEDKSLTLAERVFLTLKSGILSHDIKPREYLVIGDVANYYGISRTPVREALIKLEREGWVEGDGRRGAKVTVPSAKTFLEIVETQAALESYMARQAASKLTDEQIVELETILDRAQEFLQKNDIASCRHLAGEFHTRLYKFIDNQYMLNTVKELEEQVNRVRIILWNRGEAPMEKSIHQHREILNAIREHDADKAHQLMLYHTMWFEEELADRYKFI
ncbi:MAG: GntR family transcriptional regulator [Anaerolineae bacterium]|nr:GntR family transcriptional regulator [Anaerolineae bacterium]